MAVEAAVVEAAELALENGWGKRPETDCIAVDVAEVECCDYC